MSPLRDIYGGSGSNADPLSRKIVVVLPAFNESATIGSVLARVRERLDGYGDIELLVVDDGSTDATLQCAEEAGAIVIRHRWNEGLGVAIATGIDAALRRGADIILTMDSDGQFNTDDILALLDPIFDDRAEMVVGSRYARPDYIPKEMSLWKIVLSKMLAWMVSKVLWGKRLTDVTCGFRAYTRNAAVRLNFFSRFTYTVESIVDAVQKGISLTQVPIRARAVREHGKSRLTTNLPRYMFGIFLILTRRMRDSRPLIFYAVYALAFLSFGFVTLGALARFWPNPETRQSVLLIAGVSIINLSIILNVALLADQLLASTRILNSIVRMDRLAMYDRAARDDLDARLRLNGVPVEHELYPENGDTRRGDRERYEPRADRT